MAVSVVSLVLFGSDPGQKRLTIIGASCPRVVEVEGVLVVNSHGIVAKDLCHLRMGQVVYVRLFVPQLRANKSSLTLSRVIWFSH